MIGGKRKALSNLYILLGQYRSANAMLVREIERRDKRIAVLEHGAQQLYHDNRELAAKLWPAEDPAAEQAAIDDALRRKPLIGEWTDAGPTEDGGTVDPPAEEKTGHDA